jgi:acetolactate synthase-1/2/3 large subunit
VVVLPEDVLTDPVDVPDARRYRAVRPRPSPSDMDAVERLLSSATRPLFLVGSGGWTAESVGALAEFAEANPLPVATVFRSQDVFDNRSPSYAGSVGPGITRELAERLRQADVVVAVSARLSDTETAGYSVLRAPVPQQTLVHVSPAAEEHSRVYQPSLSVVSDPAGFTEALASIHLTAAGGWREWTARLNQEYVANLTRYRRVDNGVDLAVAMSHLRESLPRDAIVTNGAGNFSLWAHRYLQFSQFPTQLGPRSGAMGYGLPAAIAAALVHPDRTVVAVAGDGDFLMSGQELATAARYGCRLVVLVVNNNMYGTIRMHQERAYPARIIGTDLTNPDFAAYARAFGVYGARVTETAAFPAAFDRAMNAQGPALIELAVSPDVITPDLRLSDRPDGAARQD